MRGGRGNHDRSRTRESAQFVSAGHTETEVLDCPKGFRRLQAMPQMQNHNDADVDADLSPQARVADLNRDSEACSVMTHGATAPHSRALNAARETAR
jgi:hypothetical protein